MQAPPGAFREGQDAVVEGTLTTAEVFVADRSSRSTANVYRARTAPPNEVAVTALAGSFALAVALFGGLAACALWWRTGRRDTGRDAAVQATWLMLPGR